MGRLIRYLPLLAILCTAGCAPKTPDCGDEKTIALVKKIYSDAVLETAKTTKADLRHVEAVLARLPVRLTYVRTQSIDEKVGKYSCEADLEIVLPGDITEQAHVDSGSWEAQSLASLQREMKRQGIKLVGKVLKDSTRFDSQLTADTRSHVVSVVGIAPIAATVATLADKGILAEWFPDLPMRQAGLLAIESSDLQAVVGSEHVIRLSAALRNKARVTQEYPSLELTLTDERDKPVARRILAPTDYMRNMSVEQIKKGIGAGQKVALKVEFDNSAVRAVGYRMYIFYPLQDPEPATQQIRPNDIRLLPGPERSAASTTGSMTSAPEKLR